jgi:hypothetical protein
LIEFVVTRLTELNYLTTDGREQVIRWNRLGHLNLNVGSQRRLRHR